MHLQDVQTDVPNSNQIFTLADEALYEAKKDGKNKIMVKRIYLNKKKEKDNFYVFLLLFIIYLINVCMFVPSQ